MGEPSRDLEGGLLDRYQPGGAFDEAFNADGSVRDTYSRIVERFRDLDAGEVQRLEQLVADEFRRQGITFTVYSEEEGTERIWPMDLFPRLIAAAEWDELARGLSQRVAALNCFLADLYCGEGAAIADGVVPRWLVVSSQGFERNAMGISVPHSAHCTVAGIDVVRGADGRYRVLEDNLRSPSGVSYVVENRAAMAKACSWLFYDHAVQPTEQYGQMLRSTLESMAPGEDAPHIVVLTPGIFNAAYFEHAFLARSMGVELVEGRDLVVDDHTVYSRTIEGLVKVDVIYRRIDDDFLDPVAFRPDSTLGVPGLLGALRAGTVTVSNALGNGGRAARQDPRPPTGAGSGRAAGEPAATGRLPAVGRRQPRFGRVVRHRGAREPALGPGPDPHRAVGGGQWPVPQVPLPRSRRRRVERAP